MKVKRFENAYGIKKLIVTNGEKLKNVCIYASNGIFKSSFSKAMYKISKGESSKVKDRVREKLFDYEIEIGELRFASNDNKLTDNIIVYSRELYEEITLDKNDIESLLLLPDNQKKLNKYLKKINHYETTIYKKFEEVGININNIDDLKKIIQLEGNASSSKVILSFFEKINNLKGEKFDYLDFKKLDQKAYDIIDSKQFQDKVNLYTQTIARITDSDFFDKDFNLSNYKQIDKAFDNTKFLNQNRYLEINGISYKTLDDFRNIIKDELSKIVEESDSFIMLEEIEKDLGKTKESNVVRELITETLIDKNLELNRNGIKLSRIKLEFKNDDIPSFIKDITEIKKDIENIINESKEEESNYDKAIELYKQRFKPKFNIEIKNIHQAKLGYSVPKIVFNHKDNSNKEYKENELYHILSSGERNSLKIIHLIFSYERIRNLNPIVILDDIVETFDYGNRSALLMYLKDLKDSGANIILLTHNYDFYRVAINRIGLEAFEASINSSNNIQVNKNKGNKITYGELKVIGKDIDLIGVIPFARELSEIIHGTQNEIYLFFTRLMHIKKETKTITIEDVLSNIENLIPSVNINEEYRKKNGSLFYIDKVLNYKYTLNDRKLKDKLAISISIRLLLEEKIISDDFNKIEDINYNQSMFLYDMYKDNMNLEFRKLYEQALLLTPEFIHFNNFMYEPLMDIEFKNLLELFKNIKVVKESINV